uniref:Uncharacterized protein n=1 Tax=Tanacetum cinerariifolium TaxID=118510 RepID=A0A6L2KK80_TANCI|nr:hypothetical protein [Tanacetum cinerariifolium]
MIAPIISISVDTLEESVGSSTSRFVLFGTILTIIPADVSTLVPATIPTMIHDLAAEILIILPWEPKAGATIVASPAGELDLITYSSTDSDSTEDPSAPEHAPSTPATSLFLHSSDSFKISRDFSVSGSFERQPSLDQYEVTVARRRSRVALHSSLQSSPTHDLPSTIIASPAPMMMARKRVHPVPSRISANRRRFHSSSSSPPRKRLTTHSPSLSARPYHKRCRSPTTLVTSATSTPGALVHVRADLLLPRKRIRCSISALSLEDTIEESLEIGSEEDIDSNVMADIKADIKVETVAADEIRAKTEARFEAEDEANGGGSREEFEIGLDVVIQELYDHMEEIPAQRIADIKDEYGAREIRALVDER